MAQRRKSWQNTCNICPTFIRCVITHHALKDDSIVTLNDAGISSEPTSTVDVVPKACKIAEPHSRSEQLLTTAWVQHLVPPSIQGNATQSAVLVLNALTDHDHDANTVCGNKSSAAISAAGSKCSFLLTGLMFKAWSRVQVMGMCQTWYSTEHFA